MNGSLADSVINFRGPLIRDLVARGHTVHVSAPDLNGVTADAVRALGAVPHDVPMGRSGTSLAGDLRYLRAIHGLIRGTRADIVIGYTIKPNIWGGLAARLAGVRSVSMITGLGYAFIARAGLSRRLLQRLIKTLYRVATAGNALVIFQNPDDARDFQAAGCLGDPAKIRFVDGSGVDLAHFGPVPLPPAPIYLLIARLLWTKGIAEYAETLTSVRAAVPDARLQLAGYLDDGPDGVTTADLARWQAEGVEFLGSLADVRPAIAGASVYVLPSYREGTPRSVLEAMAMGRPIITTDAPGCRETTIDGVSGRLVPVGDATALAAAMIELGRDSALRERMGGEALRIAREKYAVERVNAKLLAHLGL